MNKGLSLFYEISERVLGFGLWWLPVLLLPLLLVHSLVREREKVLELNNNNK